MNKKTDCLTNEKSCRVFRSLQPEIIGLMLNAFHSEKDSLNLQMILNGFIILLEDISIYELEQTFNESTKATNKNEKSEIVTNQTTADTIPGNFTLFVYSKSFIYFNFCFSFFFNHKR